MSNNEFMEKVAEMRRLALYKKCAKALYLVGNLEQEYAYLNALIDGGLIDEAAADSIMEENGAECASLRCGDIEAWANADVMKGGAAK